MSNENFYQGNDLPYIEIAVLMEDCNKYNPGSKPFYIPAIMPDAPKTTKQSKKPQNTNNLKNKNKQLGVNSITTTGSITLPVPKQHVIYYKDRIVPAGTEFMVAFIGGDITKPQIIGRVL